MKEITDRQQEVLSFIADFTKKNAYPPTVREISAHFGISLRAVQDHLAALQKKGFLAAGKHRSRALRVLSNGESLEEPVFSARIPVFGSGGVSGKSIFSEENIESYLNTVEPLCRSGKDYFAFRVRDENMRGEGICAGDIAILERTEAAEDGTIAAVLAGGALTLARCRMENGELRFENSAGMVDGGSDARIVGTLSGIMRAYAQ
ncbi:MAG: transcriptional repressor LexA [Treponema sp.]